MHTLDDAFIALYDRCEMARRMRCKPETIAVFQAAIGAIMDAVNPIDDNRNERLRTRAEALGWTPCEIHIKHAPKRPRVDCGFCRTANKVSQS